MQSAPTLLRTDPTPAHATGGRAAVIITVLALANLSFAVLQSLVSPALSTIGTAFDADTASTSWIMTSYLLAASVMTPILGKLGDMTGKKKILVVVLALTLAGTVISALAPNLGLVIFGRVLQGAAGAVLPLSIALVRDQLAPSIMGTVIGILSAIAGIGAGIGILVAGPIVENFSWEWLFWLPGAVVLVALIGTMFGIQEASHRASGRLDLLGATVLSIALITVLLAVSKGSEWGWDSSKTVWLFVSGAVALVVFVLIELKVSEPLIDVRLLSKRGVWTAHVSAAIVGFAMFASFVLIPTMLQLPEVTGFGFGKTVSEAGLFLLPMIGTLAAFAVIAGILIRLVGPKVPLVLGSVILVASFLYAVGSHETVTQITLAGALSGAGMGLMLSSAINAVVANVSAEQTGEATSVNTIARTIGGSIGTAVVGAVIGGQVSAQGLPLEDGFTTSFWIGAAVAVVGLVAALLVPKLSAAKSGSHHG
ncbi:MFS transporter [Microbacterium gorillae]|uniref:MFS transporter n=1 Tax=Microbacterium gorillae TaxID=1231063 RepID=UPI000693E588|nr:MFS transporter [Microbacterium gorillae]